MEVKIRCVITDDEPIALKGLRSYIEKVDFLDLVGECEDAIQLVNLLKTTDVDLLFLDIEMPVISGLDVLASLEHPPKVIITSAYEQYALKGYEFSVEDYLLKPISFERFLKAVNKVYTQYKPSKEAGHIFVRSDRQTKKIFLHDIQFIESMENYVVINTASTKEVVYSTLKHFKEYLPTDGFIQVHRSYIVNMNHVRSIEANRLLIGNHVIPISRGLRAEVSQAITKGKLYY